MFLFFDTETTDLTNARAPAYDSSQPWPVAVAAILCDEELNEVAEMYRVVKLPADVVINPRAQEVHGISWDKTQAIGLDPLVVLDEFAAMAAKATYNVAYNRPFDDKVMKALAYRALQTNAATGAALQAEIDAAAQDTSTRRDDALDTYLGRVVFGTSNGVCAMDLATNFLKVPGRGMVDNGGWRRHKLTAAYKLLTGLPMPDAHNALADTRGVKEVFKAMLKATV